MCREALQETKPQKRGAWGTALSPPGGDLELTWAPQKQRASVAGLAGMVTGLAGPFGPQDPFPSLAPLTSWQARNVCRGVADLGSVCQGTLTPSHLSVQFSHKCWRH